MTSQRGNKVLARQILSIASLPPVCKCNKFVWEAENSFRASELKEFLRPAYNLFIEEFPDIRVGKRLGGGAFSAAFAIGMEYPCYSLLIRRRSSGQPGGVKTYKKAASTGAALPIIDHWVRKAEGETFDFIITQRLSSVLSLKSLVNTPKGLRLQTKLLDAIKRLGEAKVIHGDEDTEGNIMFCDDDDRVYFIDFSDTNWQHISTDFEEIPAYLKTEANQDALYESIFTDSSVSIKDIRKLWPLFATSYDTISKTIEVISILKCINDLYTMELPLPVLFVNTLDELSDGKVTDKNIKTLLDMN